MFGKGFSSSNNNNNNKFVVFIKCHFETNNN